MTTLPAFQIMAKMAHENCIAVRSVNIAELKNEELSLVAAGKLRLPKNPLKIDELLKVPTGTVASNAGIQALLDDREEGL
jgi:hypothetical protein